MISVYNHSTCPPWLLLSPKSLYHILCALQKNITMSVSRGYEDNDQFQHLQKRRRSTAFSSSRHTAYTAQNQDAPNLIGKICFVPAPSIPARLFPRLAGVDREPRKICDTLFSLLLFPPPLLSVHSGKLYEGVVS